MSIGDFIEGAFDFLLERAPRFTACLALAIAGGFFVCWLVPGILAKVLCSIGLLILGSFAGWLWERKTRRHE